MAEFYKSSFGDLRLWISKISTDKSRTLVTHEMSTGDDYVVQDRGRGPLKSRVTVMFDWMLGDDLAPIDRLKKLRDAVDDKPRFFAHPIEGTFLARVGPFNYEISDSGVITAEIELTAVSESTAVTVAGAGGIPSAGSSAVAAAAEALDLELEDLGTTTTITADTTAAADAWASADTVNPRDVLAQTGSFSDQLATQASLYTGDLGMWAAYKATLLLSSALLGAAQAVTSDTSQTFSVRIGTAIALRSLLSAIYGAEEIDQRYTQAIQLNDIPAPAWLEPGSELVLPLPQPRARSA